MDKHSSDAPPRMRDVIRQTMVICYKEDVSQLTAVLAVQGLNPTENRANYSAEELTYSRAVRCLLNHRSAWLKAVELDGYTLIAESDFVPVKGLGDLPAFWPVHRPRSWGFLYQGAPRLLSMRLCSNMLRGHVGVMTCYVVNAEVARMLLQFCDVEMEKHKPQDYWLFDSHMQWFVMGLGGEAYFPRKHYGEHGGLPNPEHASMAKLTRKGVHRADNLAAPLAFLPPYAKGSKLRFWRARVAGRAYGLGRLLLGRWLLPSIEYQWTLGERLRMMLAGAKRLLT